MLLLVKYHLKTEFIYFSLFIQKVNDSFLTFIGLVHINSSKIIQIVRLTFAVEEFDRLKHFRVLIELLNLTQSWHLLALVDFRQVLEFAILCNRHASLQHCYSNAWIGSHEQ